MNITPIKYLIYIQNCTCIFRNFRHFNKCSQFFICCWIIIELLIGVFEVLNQVIINNVKQLDSQKLYIALMTTFSMVVLILALRHSKTFDLLLINFKVFRKTFDDSVYSRNLLKRQKKLLIMSVWFIGSCIVLFIYFLIQLWRTVYITMSISWLFRMYHLILWHFRFLYEHIIVYCILFMLSEQLDVITRSIDRELLPLHHGKLNKEERGNTATVRRNRQKKLESWMTAFKNIKNSSSLYNQIFHGQLTMMVLIVILYLVIIAYVFVTTIVDKRQRIELITQNHIMLVLLSSLYAISRGGQRVQNSLTGLRQKLCELYLYLNKDEKIRRQTKDLLRYCTQSTPVRVMGSIYINMSIIPACMAAIVANTVTLLQFNNVI